MFDPLPSSHASGDCTAPSPQFCTVIDRSSNPDGKGPGVGGFSVQLRVIDINGCETILKDTIETGEPYVEILGDTSMCVSQEDTIKIKPFFFCLRF